MTIAIREKTMKLMWLEALKRRLLEEDPDFSYYHEQFRRVDAGFAGEKKVDLEWLELVYPYTFFVLHNLMLLISAQCSLFFQLMQKRVFHYWKHSFLIYRVFMLLFSRTSTFSSTTFSLMTLPFLSTPLALGTLL